MVVKYTETASRILKNDQARFNLDLVHMQDQLVACHVFTDLKCFTEISLWTDKISDAQYQKYKENLIKAEKENKSLQEMQKLEIFNQITCGDKSGSMNNTKSIEDSILVSQN